MKFYFKFSNRFVLLLTVLGFLFASCAKKDDAQNKLLNGSGGGRDVGSSLDLTVNLSLLEDEKISFTIGTLKNGSEEFEVLQPTTHGEVAGCLNNTISFQCSYIPSPDFFGIDKLKIKEINSGRVYHYNFEVKAVNDPPVIKNDLDFTIEEDKTLIMDFSSAVEDVDNSKIFLEVIQLPEHGQLKECFMRGGMVCTYIPHKDYFGNDHFSFIARDEEGAKSVKRGMVNITITPVNDPPVAGIENLFQILEDNTLVARMSEAFDPDGDEIFYEITSHPEKGKAEIFTEKKIPYLRYIPEKDFFGKVTLYYKVKDSHGTYSELPQKIQIEVTPVNDPPFLPTNPIMEFESGEMKEIKIHKAIDPDNSDSDISLMFKPDADIEISDCKIVDQFFVCKVEVSPKFKGQKKIVFYATDGISKSNEEVLTFSVGEAKDLDGDLIPDRLELSIQSDPARADDLKLMVETEEVLKNKIVYEAYGSGKEQILNYELKKRENNLVVRYIANLVYQKLHGNQVAIDHRFFDLYSLPQFDHQQKSDLLYKLRESEATKKDLMGELNYKIHLKSGKVVSNFGIKAVSVTHYILTPDYKLFETNSDNNVLLTTGAMFEIRLEDSESLMVETEDLKEIRVDFSSLKIKENLINNFELVGAVKDYKIDSYYPTINYQTYRQNLQSLNHKIIFYDGEEVKIFYVSPVKGDLVKALEETIGPVLVDINGQIIKINDIKNQKDQSWFFIHSDGGENNYKLEKGKTTIIAYVTTKEILSSQFYQNKVIIQRDVKSINLDQIIPLGKVRPYEKLQINFSTKMFTKRKTEAGTKKIRQWRTENKCQHCYSQVCHYKTGHGDMGTGWTECRRNGDAGGEACFGASLSYSQSNGLFCHGGGVRPYNFYSECQIDFIKTLPATINRYSIKNEKEKYRINLKIGSKMIPFTEFDDEWEGSINVANTAIDLKPEYFQNGEEEAFIYFNRDPEAKNTPQTGLIKTNCHEPNHDPFNVEGSIPVIEGEEQYFIIDAKIVGAKR